MKECEREEDEVCCESARISMFSPAFFLSTIPVFVPVHNEILLYRGMFLRMYTYSQSEIYTQYAVNFKKMSKM